MKQPPITNLSESEKEEIIQKSPKTKKICSVDGKMSNYNIIRILSMRYNHVFENHVFKFILDNNNKQGAARFVTGMERSMIVTDGERVELNVEVAGEENSIVYFSVI